MSCRRFYQSSLSINPEVTWKYLYKNHLYREFEAIRISHQKKNIPFFLTHHENLDTIKEFMDYSHILNETIKFPNYQYITQIKNTKEYHTYN